MIEMLCVLVLQLGIFPAAVAWSARKIFGGGKWVRWFFVAGAALLPNVWLFDAAQQADGITRAASYFAVPVFFVLALMPAAFGYHLAKPKAAD